MLKWHSVNSSENVERAIANQIFADLDRLEEIMVQRCRSLLQQPQLIQGLTNYNWWSEDLI